MILPARGKYLCEPMPRIRLTASGLWMADRLKEDKKDNIARCKGVGAPGIKDCHTCHEKKSCKKDCSQKGELLPIIAKRTDIIHYKQSFCEKFTYDDKQYIALRNEDIIATEWENGSIHAVGSMVIVKAVHAEKMGFFIVPDSAKSNSGEYWGEVVSVGPDFMDKSVKKGDQVVFMRNEGYKFKPFYGDYNYYLYAIKERWIAGKRSEMMVAYV